MIGVLAAAIISAAGGGGFIDLGPFPAADLHVWSDTRLPRLRDMNDSDRSELARMLATRSIPDRVAAYAFLQVGTPYQGGALGEAAPPDTDPIIRYDVTDCTILNLVSVALAHSSETFPADSAILRAGYAPPHRATFASRLHFTTDRLDRSPYFRDITAKLGKTSSTVVHLNRKKDGSRWIPIPWSRKRRLNYISSQDVARVKFPRVAGIAFVKRKFLADGLDVLHEGLVYEGRLVVHASTKRGEVIVESLGEIVGRYDGVVVFEYR